MRYCEACGNGHECVATADREPVEVTLARIHKEEAVEIARLQARQDRDYNETRVEVAEIDAAAQVDTAAAVAEILTAEDETGETEPETGEPIAVEIPEPEPEPEPDNMPPVVETHGTSKAKGGGYWDSYK